MKCALELLEIKAIAIKAWEDEERLKDMEAKIKYQERVANTIDFCNTVINDFLIKKAENREEISWNKKFRKETDRLGNTIIYFLDIDGYYADGRPSYGKVLKTNFDLETFTNYTATHCLTTKTEEDTYYSWGCGKCNCFKITICVEEGKE